MTIVSGLISSTVIIRKFAGTKSTATSSPREPGLEPAALLYVMTALKADRFASQPTSAFVAAASSEVNARAAKSLLVSVKPSEGVLT